MMLRRVWGTANAVAWVALGLALGVAGTARAQDTTLQPIPAAECQQFAKQASDLLSFPMVASEDDFTDLTDGSDGRSCHISGSATDQTYGSASELIAKIGTIFGAWTDEPARAAIGPDGAEKGLVSGNRIATLQVSWEPGPDVNCSEKEPLSACKILPQQKLWNAIIDIVVKGGK